MWSVNIWERKRMKKRKMSQAWKNRIWNGSILAAFVAAMAVFVFLLQTEKESAYGIRKRTGYAW